MESEFKEFGRNLGEFFYDIFSIPADILGAIWRLLD